MDHAQTVEELAYEGRMSKRDASRVLAALGRVFQRAMIAGEDVTIRNVGRFRRGAGAQGNRVLNGRKLRGAVNVVYFRTSRSLRDKMRGRNGSG
jgi:nucleoid DNA-binding protein